MKRGLPAINGTGNGNDEAKPLLLIIQATSTWQERCSGFGNTQRFSHHQYDSAGQQQWVAIYNDFDNPDAQLNAVTIDKSGNVYVTGWSGILYGHHDCTTIKYNSAGQEQW